MADAISATAAMDTAGSETARLVAPTWPLSKRIKYSLVAFLYNTLLLKPMLFSMSLKKYLGSPSEKEPDLVKRYPIRKSLTIRIFFPPSHNKTSSSLTTDISKLPTLLTIHGGGFTLGQPHDNDGWNRTFSKRHGFLVIALDYTKAPMGPFPTAIHDIEALISCVLCDPSLPLDADRVALAGWSAGGNLALAASQLPSLRGRIRAAVPLYPVLDMVTSAHHVKARARRYKPALGGFRGRDRDYLLAMMGLFNWAYLPPGQRCDDPLLSPIYAPREHLPRNVFFVACEMDLLAHEAWRMACRLAGKRVPDMDEVVGCEEPVGKGVLITEGDERFAWEEASGDSTIRWLLVPDSIHGFDQDNIASLVRDPVTMEDARIKTAKTIDLIGKWLLEGPLKADAQNLLME
ncbi:alpha/beta-hydrolase [Parathielavia appendiculata]|uniref:Alpha/beta-hydrolase n=1 Tax=Parathielavia appendiculata TaxID=2587402 RepID=A0AAN6TQP2_9PEZI|nr:alpha/beta-hydrolase [Parathielavia appendiculata]